MLEPEQNEIALRIKRKKERKSIASQMRSYRDAQRVAHDVQNEEIQEAVNYVFDMLKDN